MGCYWSYMLLLLAACSYALLVFVILGVMCIPRHCSLSLLQREIVTSWRGLGFLRDVAKSGYSPPYKTQCTMHNMDARWSVCASIVASFQFLIACSMQKRMGKAWSTLSHVPCSFCPSAGVLNIHEVQNILLLVQNKEHVREMEIRDSSSLLCLPR